MNFIKRALISITRKKSKSIILLVLVFVLGNIIIGAISVEQAVNNAERSIRRQIGGVVSVQLDWDLPMTPEWRIDMERVRPISTEAITQMGTLPYVRHYDYTTMASVEVNGITRFIAGGNHMMFPTPDDEDLHNSQFILTGVNYLGMMPFAEGNGTLIEGRTFREEDLTGTRNPIIVSQNFANHNNLNIGATITMGTNIRNRDINFDFGWDWVSSPADFEIVFSKSLDFEIIGIYEPRRELHTGDDGMLDFMDEWQENTMYVLNESVFAIHQALITFYRELGGDIPEMIADDLEAQWLQPVFILNDALDIEAFETAAMAFMPNYYMFVNNRADFDKVAGPMQDIKWIASITLYVAIGSTLLILTLLITLFLKDRRHEMGIYLSLGEKRRKVMGQILIEVLLISFIGITLSMFSGNLIGRVVSEEMLRNQLIAEQEDGDFWTMPTRRGEMMVERRISIGPGGSGGVMGYGGEATIDDVMENFNVTIGFTTVLVFYGIGLGTVLLSTIIPNLYILKLNPKKIMM